MDKLEEIVDELIALSKQEDSLGHEEASRAYDYAAHVVDEMSSEVVDEIRHLFEARIEAARKDKMRLAISRDIVEAKKDQEIACWKIKAAKAESEVASMRVSAESRRLEDHINGGLGWAERDSELLE